MYVGRLTYDAAGNLKPPHSKKQPAIVFDEEAERVAGEWAAEVLMSPTLQSVDVEQENKKGNLVEIPSATRIEARQSLRILPA